MARDVETKPLLTPKQAFEMIMKVGERRILDDASFAYDTGELRGGWRYSLIYEDGVVSGPIASREAYPKGGGISIVVYQTEIGTGWTLTNEM